MGTIVDVSDAEWEQVADLFDPDCRRGAPEVYPRRLMVEAMLWMARTGIQWRYLPELGPRSGASGGAGAPMGCGQRRWVGSPGRSGWTRSAIPSPRC
jgi:hypothetical protein